MGDERRPAGSDGGARQSPQQPRAGGGGTSPMIDLPLRTGRGGAAETSRRAGGGAGSEDRGGAGGAHGPASVAPVGVPPPRHAAGRSRSLAVWLIPALVLGIALWWVFWPAPARIVASETAVLFETARVGRDGGTAALVLTNAGERSLKISGLGFVGEGAADFRVAEEACLGRSIAPGDSCEIVVAFLPIEAGERRAVLEASANVGSPFAVPVGGSAIAPAVGLAPDRVDFGAVQVGGQRASVELTISNIGSTRLELGRISFEGPQEDEFDRDRRCPETTLEPGESCAMLVRFTPRAAGTRVAELVLASDAPSSPARLSLRGRGVWDGPPLEPEPASLGFGEQRVGKTGPATRVTFANRTSDEVEVVDVAVSPAGEPFTIVADGCGARTLLSGERCEVSVAVAPRREGDVVGFLEMGFAAAGALRVPLSARGVEPRLEIGTTGLDFGPLRTGFESAARAAELVNTGSATVEIERARIVGAGADDFVIKESCAGRSLAAGKRCAIRVAFRPREDGPRGAELEIVPSEGLAVMNVSVRGVGTVAGLALDVSSLIWESLQLGRSRDQQFEISNSGSARLQVRGLRVVGDAASDFTVARIGCALDAGLGTGERCELTVRFTPSSEGSRMATLEIDHNGPDSPARVIFSGIGDPPRPMFRASARDFGFGAVTVGSRSDIATLVISNPGGAWLPLRGIHVRGEHAADFGLVAGTCDGIPALAPGGECTVGVRFIPVAAGRRQGMLEIRHGAAGSPALISLAGVGS